MADIKIAKAFWIGILFTFLLCSATVWYSCRPSTDQHITTISLVKMYKPQDVHGRIIARVAAQPRTEWRFDDPTPAEVIVKNNATRGWEVASGVSNLAIKEGKLTGQTYGNLSLLHFERTSDLEDPDVLHSIEIRLRASKGSNLSIGFDRSEKMDLAKAVGYIVDFPTFMSTSPLLGGNKLQTYTLTPRFPTETYSSTRHIFIRPSDQAGATFEIESVRLIFRKQYLESIPSGIGWQSLKGVYHETLVSRSPESIQMNLTLPKNPWLDVSVGTIEDGPITFVIEVQGKNSKMDEVQLERTVTKAHRWEPIPLDLTSLNREPVTLRLSLKSENPGSIGFWGSPTIRSSGTMPNTTASVSPELDPPRGVILIWTDTLRRDHLDAYGYPRSTAPHIRRMAEEGTLFKDCISPATWTKVASPSVITSLYPLSHGVREFTDRLPASAITMTEVFHDAGYATLGFSSNFFTATFSNFHQGFDQLHEDGSLSNPRSSKTSYEYVDRLLPWLESHRKFPFFVFLHVYDPHDPYEPNPPYNTLWSDPAQKKEHERQLEEVRKVIRHPLMRLFGMPNLAEFQKAGINANAYVDYDRGWYDGSIRGMDAEIGRILELLRNTNMAKKTLVILAGDHGEEFLEHGRMFHGQSVYGELTDVPLIFWRPGSVPSGKSIESTVESMDVMPTILQMCGLKPPSGMQGRSLVPILAADKNSNSYPVFTEKAATVDVNAPAPNETESYAVIWNEWKLIHNPIRADGHPEFELFDHAKDPLDRNNLAAQHPDILKRYSKILKDWRKKAAAARLKPDREANQSLSQEELERMRSLGYIQ